MNVVSTILTYTLFLPLLFGGGGGVNTNTVALNTTANVTNANRIVQRIDGVWSAMGTGAAEFGVFAIAIAPDGKVYAGGPFTSMGGVANTARIAMWDGAAWHAMGTGLNGVVSGIAVAANGDVYVCGDFTDVVGGPGATYNKIARWDGSSWNAVGAGMNDYVFDVVIAANGDVYLCGEFTDVLGGPGGTYNYIARWNGTAYSALGTGLAPGAGHAQVMAVALNGRDIYVSGNFITGDGVTLNYIGMWNGTTFEPLSTGLDDFCFGLAIGVDGKLYAGGRATTFGAISANYIAAWDGSAWAALGTGVDDWVLRVALDRESGNILVSGKFTLAGGIAAADRLTQWTGSDFLPLDIDLPGPIANPPLPPLPLLVYAIVSTEHRLFLGFSTFGTAITSGMGVTAIDHAGPTRAFPSFTITRDGGTTALLESIQNLTTRKRLLFDHAMLDGEKIVIALPPGNKTITTFVGDSVNNALDDLLPGSDFGDFALAPGVNDIALYISETGAPTLTAFIQWQTTYPSIDGAPN